MRIAKLLGKLRALIDIVMSLLAAGGFSHPSKRVLPSLCKTHCYFCYFFVRFMYRTHAIITLGLYMFIQFFTAVYIVESTLKVINFHSFIAGKSIRDEIKKLFNSVRNV